MAKKVQRKKPSAAVRQAQAAKRPAQGGAQRAARGGAQGAGQSAARTRASSASGSASGTRARVQAQSSARSASQQSDAQKRAAQARPQQGASSAASRAAAPAATRTASQKSSAQAGASKGASPAASQGNAEAAQTQASAKASAQNAASAAASQKEGAQDKQAASATASATKQGKGAAKRKARVGRRIGIGSTRVKDRAHLSEGLSKKTRLSLFLQSSVLDFALVLVVAVCMVLTVSYGFHSAWAYRGNIGIAAGVCAPLILAMFAGSWSKKALLPGIAAVVVIALIEIGIAMGISPESFMGADNHIQDVEGNYVVYTLICIVCSILVYLLSRRSVFLVFLVLLTTLACGFIQWLYPEWTSEESGLAVTIVTMICLGMLVIYQCYKQSIYSANLVKRTSFFGAMGFSALVAAFCVMVGAGVFYGLVSASDAETPDIRIFQTYKSPPVDEQSNTFDRADDVSDETSDNTNDTQKDTSENTDGSTSQSGAGSSVAGALTGTPLGDLAVSMVASSSGLSDVDLSNITGDSETAESVQYAIIKLLAIFTALAIALIILAAVLIQRYRRTWRLKRMANRSNAYQVWSIYTFLLNRLSRLKMKKRESLTPLEYAVGASSAMAPFERDTDGVSFVEVSAVFQDATFGGIEPSDEELERIKGYYRAFFKNARKHVGLVKWALWKFWRI